MAEIVMIIEIPNLNYICVQITLQMQLGQLLSHCLLPGLSFNDFYALFNQSCSKSEIIYQHHECNSSILLLTNMAARKGNGKTVQST